MRAVRLGLPICEDIWTNPALGTRRLYAGKAPLEHLAAERCDLVVNLSASPWHETKADVRNSLVVTDTQSNVRHIVELVSALDGSAGSVSSMKVFQLHA